MLMLTGRFSIDPQTRGAFLVFAKGMVERQRSQSGCMNIGIYEDITQPYTFMMIEQWENYDSFNRFGLTQTFEHDEATLNSFMVGEPSYDEYEFSVPPELN